MSFHNDLKRAKPSAIFRQKKTDRLIGLSNKGKRRPQ
jgi:hypothetical protein